MLAIRLHLLIASVAQADSLRTIVTEHTVSLQLALLPPSAFQMFNHILNRKSARLGFRNEMLCQLAQMPVAVAPAGGLVRSRSDKSSHASACLNHAGTFQFRVDLRDGISVYAQFHRQLSDRGQLLANAQLSGGNRKPDRPFKLSVKRRWVICVYLKHLAPLYYDTGTS